MSKYLIVGLGNPGERYIDTPHNVGFEVVSSLIRRFEAKPETLCNSLVAETEKFFLVMPMTYMNLSGDAVRCLVELMKLDIERVIVVVDDISLPLGKIRIRAKGGSGGHRGLASIIYRLETDNFPRIRLGIAPPDREVPKGDELVEYVLTKFDNKYLPVVDEMVHRAVKAIEVLTSEGIDVAMNKFN